MVNYTEKTSQSKMTLNIYDPEVERKIRQIVEETGGNINAVLNNLLEGLLTVPLKFSNDYGENIREAGAMMGLLNWEDAEFVRTQLQAQLLTRNVDLRDVIASSQIEGIRNMKQKLENSSDSASQK